MKKLFQKSLRVTLGFLCILSFIIGISFRNHYASSPIQERNKREISRIKVHGPDDFSFAVFGDNKGNDSYFEPLLRSIDQDKEIAFAIDIGDLVGHGERGEFRRFISQVEENLAIPFLTAPGNHDFKNGFDNYREIFGEIRYSFQVGQCSFIVLAAANDSGFNKLERQWLGDELRRAQDAKARFVFMHIPPFDPRSGGSYVPEKDKNDLQGLFKRYKVTHLFASHIHGYFSGTWGTIPYTISGGGGARLQGDDPEHFFHHYVKVHVNDGNVDTTVRRINKANILLRLYDMLEDRPIEGGLLLCAGTCFFAAWLPLKRRTPG